MSTETESSEDDVFSVDSYFPISVRTALLIVSSVLSALVVLTVVVGVICRIQCKVRIYLDYLGL